MITTRERVKLSELLKGIIFKHNNNTVSLLQKYIPIITNNYFFINQGKAAFEQFVLAGNLQNSKILIPAFLPDDFIGIFKKYNIVPDFIDVDRDTYHINLNLITPQHLNKAKALVILHTFGLPLNGSEAQSFCRSHRLVLIEDCARAFGAVIDGKQVGSFGDFALYSLPKCFPIRQGGIGISKNKFTPKIEESKLNIFDLFNTLMLIKIPLLNFLEPLLYKIFADTSVYPREIGIMDLIPARKLDYLARFVFDSYLPNYQKTLVIKRKIALRIRRELEPMGFKFQKDNGNHIYTVLSTEPPSFINSDELSQYLINNGVKTSVMWRSALGVSDYAKKTWNTNTSLTPEANILSKRLIQLPINRFQKNSETEKIISLCTDFVEKGK